jgi:hypothetical protein
MTVKAEENYTKIVRTVDPVTLNIWEQQILRAESERAENISAMDIYQAKIPGLLAGPESRDSSGLETDSRDFPGSGVNPTPQEQWMEFALLVEDTQLVYCFVFTQQSI